MRLAFSRALVMREKKKEMRKCVIGRGTHLEFIYDRWTLHWTGSRGAARDGAIPERAIINRAGQCQRQAVAGGRTAVSGAPLTVTTYLYILYYVQVK
jgi:hypothetical protein